MTALDDLRLRSRVRVDALLDLVPEPWDMDLFIQRLSEQRGRPILLRPFQAMGGPSPCGLYMATALEDHILYPEQVGPLQREHVILHEISHMLHDAEPDGTVGPPMDPEYAALLFPDIPLNLIRQALSRTGYSTEVERLAEGFADEFRRIIFERRQQSPAEKITDEQRAIAERLGAALKNPRSNGG